jgi:hypothetical protein
MGFGAGRRAFAGGSSACGLGHHLDELESVFTPLLDAAQSEQAKQYHHSHVSKAPKREKYISTSTLSPDVSRALRTSDQVLPLHEPNNQPLPLTCERDSRRLTSAFFFSPL